MSAKNLQLERTVFFCDAVVAIAITLLAIDLKAPFVANGNLTFENLLQEWKIFLAFLLSFFNIANFWKTHHTFFAYIKKMDEKLLWFNILWLLFIILIPFSSSLVSDYFSDNTAMLFYSANILMISSFQNLIWDYASLKDGFIIHDDHDEESRSHIRIFCNLEMINSGLAVACSLFFPILAFIILFTKFPMLLVARIIYTGKAKKDFMNKLKKNNG